MFGIHIITDKKLEQIKEESRTMAFNDLVGWLQQDGMVSLLNKANKKITQKTFKKPVTLIGSGAVIEGCIFKADKSSNSLLNIKKY